MAAGWDGSRRWGWEVSRTVGEWLVEALDPQPGETILELAAGLGDRAAVRQRIERELEPHAAEDGSYELKGTCLNVLAI